MSLDPAARIPRPRQNRAERDLAALYAPVIYFNQKEPFFPLVAGYTIFRGDAQSPSFPRRIELAAPGHEPAALAIEYAIWWDWDIQHLYEIEHTWTYVGQDGRVVFADASWHGGYSSAVLGDGTVPLAPGSATHPVVYSQPGKHAFVPMVEGLLEVADENAVNCGPKAGSGGLWVVPLFEDALTQRKNPQVDALVASYLRARAFTPAGVWDREFPVTRDMLIPWPALFEWVPRQIDWWIARLRSGEA